MPRKPRIILGNHVYHILNRASHQLTIFQKPADYLAFLHTLHQAQQRYPLRILSFCLMPNHFHLVLWPNQQQGPLLSTFMRWLQVTHTQRHHAHYHSAGTGHLYQGRFKSFPVQSDQHLRTLCRYVERNPLRAKLVPHAELWPFSSLHERLHPNPNLPNLLSNWPAGTEVPLSRWIKLVNTPQSPRELLRLQTSLNRGTPLGSPAFIASTAKSQNLSHTLRPPGRPKKGSGVLCIDPRILRKYGEPDSGNTSVIRRFTHADRTLA